jgi:hypothetical protein
MKRVFLSFASEDLPLIRGLRLLAWNPNFILEFYDESVRVAINSHNADYIKRVIRDKIARSSVTVCLIGHTTYRSDWVAWELEESISKGNSLIAMAVKGVNRAILPARITQMGLPFHGWDPKHLNALIEGVAQPRRTTSTPRF